MNKWNKERKHYTLYYGKRLIITWDFWQWIFGVRTCRGVTALFYNWVIYCGPLEFKQFPKRKDT